MAEVFQGVGLDIGTMNVIAARRSEKGVETKRMRDLFLDLPISAKKMLKISDTSFVERARDVLILGDAALEVANVFGREPRRPLAAGLISSKETDSLEVLGLLIRAVLGNPVVENEHCVFSVPATPIDADRDVVYHQKVFEGILRKLGYTPEASTEGMGIVFSECAEDKFSGLCFSFGCLTPETPIFTRRGLIPIVDVVEGDEVLTRAGVYGRVVKTWTRHHNGEVFKVSFEGNPFGVTLTGNHRVWVQRDSGWEWVEAASLENGDIVGEPVVSGYGRRKILALTDKTTNGPAIPAGVDWSMQMGRFLGYFLADGHITSQDDRYGIWFTFGPNEQEYVDDVVGICDSVLKRAVTVTQHGNALRCQLSHKSLNQWLTRHCYHPDTKEKVFPLNIEDLRPGLVEGIVTGLIRGDGWTTTDSESKCLHFSNTSQSIITALHLLVGRMGLTSTITVREPRSATFQDGRTIQAENCKNEWALHVTGIDGQYLHNIVSDFKGDRRAPRVWKDGGFRCTRIKTVDSMLYDGLVHDLTVEGDPSFSAPYITMHNSGMTNVALGINTLPGVVFSVARGGDWIDQRAAESVGATKARMCALKEAGIDLTQPKDRNEQAIVFYYEALIDYALDQVATRFRAAGNQFALTRPIPLVVAGGTALAGGFMGIFERVLAKHREAGFPIEVSGVRLAKDPLNAIAYGMLVQAQAQG